jgi:hypothetical protein
VSNPTILPALDGWRKAPAAVKACSTSSHSAWVAECADRQGPTVYTGVDCWIREWDPSEQSKTDSARRSTDSARGSDEKRGRCGIAWLLGQVVLFLSFDGVMLTVPNDHRVQMMMFSLFDLCPGRPAQGVYEVETSCFAAELFALDLLL